MATWHFVSWVALAKKRCNYAADKTGHVLMHTCLDDAITAGVKFLMDHELLEIGLEDGKVEGVVLRNIQDGQIYPVLCKSLVIATGGYTRIFYNRTSVPFIATGDGIAAALKVGLGFEDPEMLQFHPNWRSKWWHTYHRSRSWRGWLLVKQQGRALYEKLSRKDGASSS